MRQKICVVASYAPSILVFRKELVVEMAKTCDVYVCVPFLTGEVKNEIERLGVVVLDIKMKSESMALLDNIKYFYALYIFFKKIKPNIVLSYTIKPVIWGSFAAKFAGIKKITSMITGLGHTFTEVDSLKREIINKFVCVLYKCALYLNQVVIFQNHDDQALFEYKNILRNTPSIVINGSGVNLEYFDYHPTFPEKITFLMTSRLLKYKGIYEYIEAARYIKSVHRNIDFNLLGWIDDSPSSITSDELNAWCEEGTINFLGKQKDVRDSLRAASVFVLPSSYREGVPRSILEAMSMGRAIITTDSPGCKETVIHGANGYLVPIKNVEKLIESMLNIINNVSLIYTFGQKSREIAEAKYDVYEVNRNIMAALNLP